MCGIFATVNSTLTYDELKKNFNLTKHRGPDDSSLTNFINDSITLGFHRLQVNGLSNLSMQPLRLGRNFLICNGEIFNHKTLEKEYGLVMRTGSDCEVILHLYNHFGGGLSAFKQMLQVIEAEFAMILYDEELKKLFVARDPFGVRPLFWSVSVSNSGGRKVCISSELKSLSFCENVAPFLPATYVEIATVDLSPILLQKYYHFPTAKIYPAPSIEVIYQNINTILKESVAKRLMSDRPVGCCLSGGLDSSLITALVSENLPNVECFTIGLSHEGLDVIASQKVVTHLNANGHNLKHHIVTFSVKEGFNALRDVIYHLESYDTTSIRAGVCNYLLAKYIKENTDITVLYSGSGADELLNGYQYGKMILDEETLEIDSKRLLNELYIFDNLRDDRCTAAFGLELRVPLLDPKLIDYVFSISAKHRLSHNTLMEKMLLRESFKNDNLLPEEMLYRRKDAFSDAVNSAEESWYLSLQKLIDPLVSNEDMEKAQKTYPHMAPTSKENYYYRQIFEELFPGREHVISHFWLPPAEIVGAGITDPSATILKVYQQ